MYIVEYCRKSIKLNVPIKEDLNEVTDTHKEVLGYFEGFQDGVAFLKKHYNSEESDFDNYKDERFSIIEHKSSDKNEAESFKSWIYKPIQEEGAEYLVEETLKLHSLRQLTDEDEPFDFVY